MPRFTQFDLNKCVNFNQTTSKINFTVPTSFDPANLTQFTFAVWVNPRTFTVNAGPRIFDPNGAAGLGFQVLWLGEGNLQASTLFNTTNALVTSGVGVFKKGEWQRIVMTWDDANNVPSVYRNSVSLTPATSTNKSGSRVNWSTTSAIIGNRNANDRGYDGLMDEFCVWNRILTAQEIQDDTFKGLIPTDAALILRYKMDEASGNLVDSSASALTGTPTNVTQNVTSYSIPARTAI